MTDVIGKPFIRSRIPTEIKEIPRIDLTIKSKILPKGKVVVLGWAKDIVPRSKSKSLVALTFNKGVKKSNYYLSYIKEAYEWKNYFGVPKDIIDKILKLNKVVLVEGD